MSAYPFRRSFIRNFAQDRSASELTTAKIRQKLINLYPTITRVQKSKREDDLNGVDFWINHASGRFGIDVKKMSTDPRQAHGNDTLVLEQYSDVNLQSPGWTLDRNHITDLVVWYYIPTDRVFILDYRVLRDAFITNVHQWSHAQSEWQKSVHNFRPMRDQHTEMPDGHLRVSRAIRVPVGVVIDAMQKHSHHRQGVEIHRGQQFCRIPDCCQLASNPASDPDPIWCNKHFAEVFPKEKEIASLAKRRAELEEAAVKSKMRDLAEYRARKTAEASRPNKGADTNTITMDFA